MKIINNILYIEFGDFMAAGWKEDTIKKANLRNGSYWMMIPDPADKRKVLVEFDCLRKKDKDRLTAHFGDPNEYVAKEPIRKMLILDAAAELYYRDYRYDADKMLPFEHQTRYTTAASWLNLLLKLNADKKIIKKELSLTLEKFWSAVTEIIKADTIELPTSYRRLLSKMDDYKTAGYDCLIDWRFGNKIAAKLGKASDGYDEELYEKQLAFIRKAASMHQHFDAQQITSFVNPVFEKQGWETVSRATVYSIMQANKHLTTAGNRGKREYSNSISMQHKRRRPDYPLYYATLDGWTAELLYQSGSTYNNRLVVVIVLDAFNNYPLGFAIGDRENTDLIRMANRNAATHIRELFGDHYQVRQLQSDNYGIKNLTPFYAAMAKLHTPAAVGNAKSKVIEPYFSYLNKKYCQRFPNWSGYNVTAKKANQPNTEFLDKIKKKFPDRAGVIQQIEMIIAQERKIKAPDYIASFDKCSDKLIQSHEDRLMVYGKPHAYTNRLIGQGLQITLGGERLTFDSFNPAFRAMQMERWQVVYDEHDLSAVLAITEDGSRRFLLERKRVMPMDVHSTTKEDREYSSRINAFNKARMAEVVQTYIDDNAAVAEVMGSTPLNLNDYDEATLKLLFTDNNGQQKEALQNAKGLKSIQQNERKAADKQTAEFEKSWAQQQAEYLQSKNDFNQYLD